MKTKPIGLAVLLLLVSAAAFTSLKTIKADDFRDIFRVKGVHAAEAKYYVFTYDCQCNGFVIPPGCDGTPASATCSSPTGRVSCSKGFACTFIYYSSCNGQSQAPCPPPA